MSILRSPRAAVVTGALMLVPLAMANAIVADRVEPFFSLVRPGPHPSAFEYVLLVVVLTMLPVGAFIAARPMVEGWLDGTRRVYALNVVVATFLLVIFFAVSAALGDEIYRCDVLRVPNCD